LAVDGSGAVYVSNAKSNAVVKLAAGATSWTTIPVTGLDTPGGLAVDSAGTLYLAGGFRGNPRVLKVPAGQTNQTVLVVPYAQPAHIAVDTAGNVYVGTSGSGVWKLPAGATDFVSLHRQPEFANEAVAADSAGNVYFIDLNSNQVFKLPPGATSAMPLPFTNVRKAVALAVDNAGNVYLADSYANRVVKLPPA
jgi:serine/threonine protein kinase, bacterial